MDSGINIFSSRSRRSQDAASPPDGPSVQRKRDSLIPPSARQTSQAQNPNKRNGSIPTTATKPSQPASRAASVPKDPIPSAGIGRAPSLISLKTALWTAPAKFSSINPQNPGAISSATSSSSDISPTDTRKRRPRTKRTLLVGISGAPASGKTSLALLLSFILPSAQPVFVIHQDDHHIPRHLRVPTDDNEPHDNARDAVDFSTFKKLLQYAKREGQLPKAFKTVHDEPTERERAKTLIREEEWRALRSVVAKTMNPNPDYTLGIVEGPLLFHDAEIRDLLDVQLFLWASVDIARTRWLDAIACGNHKAEGVPSWLTQDHFDRTIWWNYVQETRHIFHRGDVAGVAHQRVCNELRIRVQPKMDSTLSETMHWAVDMVVNDLEKWPHEAAGGWYRRRSNTGDEPEGGWRGVMERVRCVLYKLV